MDVISSRALLSMRLIIHAGIKVKPCNLKRLPREEINCVIDFGAFIFVTLFLALHKTRDTTFQAVDVCMSQECLQKRLPFTK